MTFADWVAESRERVEEYGYLKGSKIAALKLWEGALIRFGEHVYNFGTPVYEREWDVLVVLDACRPDLLAELARTGEYEFLPVLDSEGAGGVGDTATDGDGPGADLPTHVSPASQSEEWLSKTFGPGAGYDDEVARTAHVTANPFSSSLDGDRFAYLDEVWRYAWDDDFGGIPPGPVTDRAVAAGRSGADFDRLVVHYMQPHVPFRSGEFDARMASDGDRADHGKYVWYELRDGDVAFEDVWAAYRDNLQWVLEEGVAPLLENMDADRVVITADHGNAVGEWGVYEHPPHVPVPAVKRVPWVETTATDRHTLDPDLEPDPAALSGRAAPGGDGDGDRDRDGEGDDPEDEEIRERLQALGYK